jgi:hypothetical protein
MNFISRITTTTPKFFRVLRNIGLVLAAAGGVIVTTDYELPDFFSRLGEYLIVAGSIASAVAQAVVEGNEK